MQSYFAFLAQSGRPLVACRFLFLFVLFLNSPAKWVGVFAQDNGVTNDVDYLKEVQKLITFGESLQERKRFNWLSGPLEYFKTMEHPPRGRSSPIRLHAIGAQWNQLKIYRSKLDWMEMGNDREDEKYAWAKLRQTNNAWIESRGVSERYVYVDGCTISPCAFSAKLNPERRIQLEAPNWIVFGRKGEPFLRGLAIHVNGMGDAKGSLIEVLQEPIEIGRLDVRQMEQALKSLVQKRNGLNECEAESFLSLWRQRLLQRPGTRIVVRIPNSKVEELVFTQLRPRPEELVQIGLVIIEVD